MSNKKNVSTACTACQRRKVKCVGNPCAYCLKKNYPCEFKQSKKRGPNVIKLPTDLRKFDLLNHVQEDMGSTCLQQNFVDFYFENLGSLIPKIYKTKLLCPTQNNTEMRTQIYIITANIMKVCGNKEQETQYFNKAYKSSSVFDNDTLESAISLMMMAQYLGRNSPKAKRLLLIAKNTLSMPNIEETEIAIQTRHACHSCFELFDPNLDNISKANYLLSNILHLDLVTLAQVANKADLLTVGIACIASLMIVKGNLDDTNVSTFLTSLPFSFINDCDRLFMLEYICKFDIALKFSNDSSGVLEIYSNFVIEYSKFMVEWRSGYQHNALCAAKKAMDIFITNSQMIALRSTEKIVGLLLLPYYFKKVGIIELSSQLLLKMEEVFGSIGRREEYNRLWEEICGNLHSYNIIQLETELLGSSSLSTTSSSYNSPTDSPSNSQTNSPSKSNSPFFFPSSSSSSSSSSIPSFSGSPYTNENMANDFVLSPFEIGSL